MIPTAVYCSLITIYVDRTTSTEYGETLEVGSYEEPTKK